MQESAADPINSATVNYLSKLACSTGELFGNLLSLELLIRIVLYESGTEPMRHYLNVRG